ncbi:MAG: Holliday junction branch migration protein RuvA [Chloroflexi bacterium]|nr:Holliday junction branch migration protein RuvA [Chloroflexota bacterium]
MIAGVRGTLARIGGDHVIVLCGGFYLRVFVPLSTMMSLPAIGEPLELHTHLYLREDALALFGFLAEEELSLFNLLLTVQSVGPRLALSLLSVYSPLELRAALGRGDEASLQRVPGVGKRTAARLVLELRERVGRIDAAPPTAMTGSEELVNALIAWGYRRADAERALQVAQVASIADQGARLAAAAAYLVQQSTG